VRSVLAGSGGCSASTRTLARSAVWVRMLGSTPRAVNAAFVAAWRTVASSSERTPGARSLFTTAVTLPSGPGISATSSPPEATAARAVPASGVVDVVTGCPNVGAVAVSGADSA